MRSNCIQKKTTFWCGIWAGGIISPYFFKNEAGRNVIINGARYRAMMMITDYLLPEIEARNIGNIWVQQDGATCHTAHETMALLREHFGEQLISRNQDRVISHLWTSIFGDT